MIKVAVETRLDLPGACIKRGVGQFCDTLRKRGTAILPLGRHPRTMVAGDGVLLVDGVLTSRILGHFRRIEVRRYLWELTARKRRVTLPWPNTGVQDLVMYGQYNEGSRVSEIGLGIVVSKPVADRLDWIGEVLFRVEGGD